MLVKNITFVSDLQDIVNIEDENIDVFVELENNYIYTLVVATARNIEFLMDKNRMNYFEAGHPFIIVKKLTKEIVTQAIEEYASDTGYWLKLYHFAGEISSDVFDKLEDEQIKLNQLEDS